MAQETFQQKDQGFLTYPDSGWRKAMFKWPVQLWRLGLGPLIGHHMMLISQTGRKSGLTRRTMTELYQVDGKKYAPSGFGRRSQWVLNLEADPRATIQTAAGVESMRAVRVEDEGEMVALLETMRGRSDTMFNYYLETLGIEPHREDILAKRDRFYWLRFDPTYERTPPPLPADLAFLWPVAFGALFMIWLVSRKK